MYLFELLSRFFKGWGVSKMSICCGAVAMGGQGIGMGGWRDAGMACDEVQSDDLGVMRERFGVVGKGELRVMKIGKLFVMSGL